MTQSHNVLVTSRLADAAITQYQAIKVTSTGVDVSTAGSDKMIGVAQEAAAIGEMVPVRLLGTSKAVASTTISAGARVKPTTGGKIVTTTSDHDGYLGIALEAAGADGDIIEILLTPGAMISL